VQRELITIALVALSSAAHAQPAPAPSSPGQTPPSSASPSDTGDPGSSATAPALDPGSPGAPPVTPAPTPIEAAPASDGAGEIGDQAILAEVGIAAGGRVTPGGLRIAGQFLYQLSDNDWFDGGASFTFGSGAAACFRDRENRVICSHGLADGAGVELSASVRRMFTPQGAFHPFVRVGVGLGLVGFDADDVSGVTVPAHAGGGVRVAIAPAIAIVAEGELELGFGSFSRNIGSQLQFGLTIAAGVEFRLR